ncbi:HAMP domain-containing sensor histidine kinase [Anaerocolumna sp. AGMB13025]|uniref:sensor histidine kinase n=1 Tax=Anaerocolumna sp. AGMB13025 TaxID=3039116 RepID=UPI0024202859|nr:HAMP domain-containing sensor histidine kinase [Anaerocolumna sp. AGMB13025]WFR55680.1 HAMP domain-containing sensor histidine kinase [Anaerocolumna sp. AGMB13025]
MKYATRLLVTYLFFSILSFSIIIISVNKAIDYYSFVTIEKQMIEKADISELSFREILTRYETETEKVKPDELAQAVLEVLKASGVEVRIYDSNSKLIGSAKNGIIVNNGSPKIYKGNIKNALKGNYSYLVTDNKLIYFAIPVQDKYYQNVYVFEIVENISYYYDIMHKVRTVLLTGAGGFIVLITLSSLYIARKTTKPIKYLLGATEKFSKQQFEPVKLNRKDELGMLAEGLNQMGIKLNSYIQYQKQFVSNVSHELKTPLAAIRGFSQYLNEGDNEDKELKKIYSHLLHESDRLTKLIDELLILSRFDKASDLKTEKEDLSELTYKVVRSLQPKADMGELIIETDLRSGVMAEVNPVLMTHAVSNILDNAIKYSNTGGHIRVEAYIKEEIDHSLNMAVIKIRDQGIGIHQDELALVQERFYRAGNSITTKGSGLGLSLCKEIIEKFNGRLNLESEFGVGTTVTILLPLA